MANVNVGGDSACAISIVRLVSMVQEWYSVDFTWDVTTVGIWSYAHPLHLRFP